MTDEPTVEVTIGRLGDGEETIELGPGESLSDTFSDPAYVEVRVSERVSADGSGGSGSPTYAVSDTSIEQEETSSDREWTVDTVRCPNCGKHFPADYSRCQKCGTPNKEAN